MFVLDYKYFGEDHTLDEDVSFPITLSKDKKTLYQVAVFHFRNEWYNRTILVKDFSLDKAFSIFHPFLSDCILKSKFKEGFLHIQEMFKNHFEYSYQFTIVELVEI